jgi:hypothetical protein
LDSIPSREWFEQHRRTLSSTSIEAPPEYRPRAPEWRGGMAPPISAVHCSETGGVMIQSWPTYTVSISGNFPNRDIWVPAQA